LGRKAANAIGTVSSDKQETTKKKQDDVMKPSTVHYSLGDFELLDSSKGSGLPDLPTITREQPLSPEEWQAAFSKESTITNPKQILKRIFYGGVDPSIRSEVWKYLLKYYPWDSTAQQRKTIREAKALEYNLYKSQWVSITPEQETHHSKFRTRKTRIEKDVWRTDREQLMFKEKKGPGLRKLHDILMSYCFFNFDLGYVQGMNDLLSPILLLLDDEVDSFWCFKGLMDMMEANFHKDQNGMHTQLVQLEKLLHCMDPVLHTYLQSVDCLNMYFCFRWILITFKREFKLNDIQRLWEVCWTSHLHPKFHLFVALAVLITHREKILSQKMRFDDILRFTNDLAGTLNAEELLKMGEALFLNFERITDDDVKAKIFEVPKMPPQNKAN